MRISLTTVVCIESCRDTTAVNEQNAQTSQLYDSYQIVLTTVVNKQNRSLAADYMQHTTISNKPKIGIVSYGRLSYSS
jgi:hypothetical protein